MSAQEGVEGSGPAKPTASAAPTPRSQSESTSFPIVGVGASAGGLDAFVQLLSHLPLDSGMAFVLVQHLDPKHGSMLPQILSRATKIPVHEVNDGSEVQPNHIYVIPPNASLTLSRGILHLAPHGQPGGPHLIIDCFLRSLAEAQKSKAIGVILSGTASDGVQGLRAIKAEGGITLAQDEKSAKQAGMPRSAVATGCVDLVLPPAEIALELARIGRQLFANHSEAAKTGETLPAGDDQLDQILSILRTTTGVDFRFYRQSTVKRRILRRMVLQRQETLEEYIKHLQRNPNELRALYGDILINVTSFFRDPTAFEVLKATALPCIMKKRAPAESIRVWVPGCATGEEAYSIAICLLEFLGDSASAPPIQVFATDINELALEKARAGIYTAHTMHDISSERIRRFFVNVDNGYQINKGVRELCVFARQDMTRDPPFSNLDLISCRNVMIYLEPVLQKRVLPVFYYALKPHGVLMLGAAETPGAFLDMFAVVDAENKVYSKKSTPARPNVVPGTFVTSNYGMEKSGIDNAAIGKKTSATNRAIGSGLDIAREADRITLDRYAPAGVIVNDALEILQFRGRTGPYLEPTPGAASLNLLKMARGALAAQVRAAFLKAKQTNMPVKQEGLAVELDGQLIRVNVEVVPLRTRSTEESCFLVLFEKVRPAADPESEGTASGDHGADQEVGRAADSRVAQLMAELAATKEYLQSVIEAQEFTNEELTSANEEILSSNEELQSTNEELETAQEELQSGNEELTTVNEELQNRNLELGQLNNDLINVLASVSIPIVMVGKDLRIRRFTPEAQALLNLIPSDLDRPISDIRPNIKVPNLKKLILRAIDGVSLKQREIRDQSGRWYSLRIHPYRTADNKIEGAVVALFDIDTLKHTMDELRESLDYAKAIVETVREPLLILTPDLHVITANRSFCEFFHVSRKETEKHFLFDLGNGQWNIPTLRPLLEEIVTKKSVFHDFEVAHTFEHIGPKTMLLNARQIHQRSHPPLILLAMEDITERKLSEQLRASEARYRRLFEVAFETAQDGIALLDADTRQITDVNPFVTRLLGYSRQELQGKQLWELGNVEDAAASRDVFDELLEQGYIRYEHLPLRTKDGRQIDVEFVSSTFMLDTKKMIQCIIRNVTEHNRLTGALRRRAEELAEANRAKDEFLSTLSHELRTPLTSMLGWAQMLRMGKLDEPTAARGIELIYRSAKQQTQLIEDLLDISRIITGKLQLNVRLIQLAPIVTTVIDTMRPAADAKGVRLESVLDSAAGPVSGDPDRLQQVVWNLLSNAIKFTPAGGRVEVRLERVDSRVRIRVSDTGTGISAGFLPHIFERFRQADTSSTRSHGGLGVGLAIVRQLLELHGGTVQAESLGEHQGSTFTVNLPLKLIHQPDFLPAPDTELAAPSAGLEATSEKLRSLEGLRVLVVEDEADTREMLRVVLEACGAQVTLAASAAEALDALAWSEPHVLVSDIAMPEEDGYDLIRKVRRFEEEHGKSLPAVALSAYARDEERKLALAAGFQMHVAKPVKPTELVAAIGNLAGRAESLL